VEKLRRKGVFSIGSVLFIGWPIGKRNKTTTIALALHGKWKETGIEPIKQNPLPERVSDFWCPEQES